MEGLRCRVFSLINCGTEAPYILKKKPEQMIREDVLASILK